MRAAWVGSTRIHFWLQKNASVTSTEALSVGRFCVPTDCGSARATLAPGERETGAPDEPRTHAEQASGGIPAAHGAHVPA